MAVAALSAVPPLAVREAASSDGGWPAAAAHSHWWRAPAQGIDTPSAACPPLTVGLVGAGAAAGAAWLRQRRRPWLPRARAQDVAGSRAFCRCLLEEAVATVPPPAIAEEELEAQAAEDSSGHVVAQRPSEFRELVEAQLRGEVPADEIRGVETGWAAFDEFYRVVRGEVTIVTGIPGSGKSEFLLALATKLAIEQGWTFGMCTLEARQDDVFVQLMEKARKRTFKDLTDKEKTMTYEKILREKFKFLDSNFEQPRIEEILTKASYQKDIVGMDGLIIDPYNYLTRPDSGSETRYVASLLSRLKEFAQENRIHIWLVAHPVKKCSWGSSQRGETVSQPSLYDVAGSAHFYNMCDMGLVVQRDKETRAVTLHVSKVRNKDAGKVGSVPLWFDRQTRCYGDTHDQGSALEALFKQ